MSCEPSKLSEIPKVRLRGCGPDPLRRKPVLQARRQNRGASAQPDSTPVLAGNLPEIPRTVPAYGQTASVAPATELHP